MKIRAKNFLGRPYLVAALLSIPIIIIFIPGLPWSSRVYYTLNRLKVKAEIRASRWRGHEPKLVSITGTLSIPSGRIEAIDSASGWATLADSEGRFEVRDVMWYPGAKFELVISNDHRSARVLKIISPDRLPESGILDAGFLDLARAEDIDIAETQGINSITWRNYDVANLTYYQSLFAQLTEGKNSDEDRLEAVNSFVASKLNYEETARQYESPKQIIERGSRYCGNLALAMATIVEAGNFRTRVLDIIDSRSEPNAHVVVEIYYQNGWHLYDPTYGAIFKRADGGIVNYKELRLDSSLITPDRFGSMRDKDLRALMEWMPGVYRSGLHHFYQFEDR